MKNYKEYHKVSANVAAEIKILYQKFGIRGKELLSHFPNISKANVYKHVKKLVGQDYVDGRKSNKGRPRKIDAALRRR